jgi:hypothetical protein
MEPKNEIIETPPPPEPIVPPIVFKKLEPEAAYVFPSDV